MIFLWINTNVGSDVFHEDSTCSFCPLYKHCNTTIVSFEHHLFISFYIVLPFAYVSCLFLSFTAKTTPVLVVRTLTTATARPLRGFASHHNRRTTKYPRRRPLHSWYGHVQWQHLPTCSGLPSSRGRQPGEQVQVLGPRHSTWRFVLDRRMDRAGFWKKTGP